MAKINHDDPLSLEDAGRLLRRWQLNEWAMDRRTTKKAIREQRAIVEELLSRIVQRPVTTDELDHVLGSMN